MIRVGTKLEHINSQIRISHYFKVDYIEFVLDLQYMKEIESNQIFTLTKIKLDFLTNYSYLIKSLIIITNFDVLSFISAFRAVHSYIFALGDK